MLDIKNLIFEGGGVKGIAYVGALEELETKGLLKNLERTGGTSAGAIIAVLVGLNFSLEEIEVILSNLTFTNFLDDNWGLIRDSKRLTKYYGWYKGDFFHNWIAEKIEQKTGDKKATFGDIYKQKSEKNFKDIYLVGSNLSTRFSEVFSYEHTPDMCIADAARISMSIPFFFRAIRSQKDDIYVDGGLMDNYPIKLFDRFKYITKFSSIEIARYQKYNKKLSDDQKDQKLVYNPSTLGFRLDSKEEIDVFHNHSEPVHYKINNFFDYINAFIKTVLAVQDNNYHLKTEDWRRTVYIDTLGIGTTDFDISDNKKRALKESGHKGTKKYLEDLKD